MKNNYSLVIYLITVLFFFSAASVFDQTELGDLVVWLMLNENQEEPTWQMHSNPESVHLYWNNDGVTSDKNGKLIRKGLASIAVNNEIMWTLKSEKEEVKWDVSLIGTKFGVEKATIWPGAECFGTGSSGCDFEWDDVFKNIENNNVNLTKLCSLNSLGQTGELFEISSNGKQDAYIMYGSTAGSGGETNWVELWWENSTQINDVESACDFLKQRFE